MGSILYFSLRRTHTIRSLWSDTTFRLFSSKEVTSAVQDIQDYLLQNIKSSTETDHVLKIVGSHHDIMNKGHVIQALRSLFELKKAGNSKISKEQMISNPDFIKLCKRLKSQARGFAVNDAIESLKIISYMGVPGDSVIVQTLLQLIRHEVNDLSLQQIIFLEFLFKNFDRNPLIDALRIALPLVFEAQLNLKMNRDDATHLAELLHYSSKKSLSDSSVDLIVNSLGKIVDDIDVNTARSIVWSFGDMKRSVPSHWALLTHCWNILAENIDQCTYNVLDLLLNRMVNKYSKKQTQFYNEKFVESCVNYIIMKDCGFEKGTWIQRKLTRMGHVNLNLLDYLAQKLLNDQQIGEECKTSPFFSFVSGLANANYKPACWDSIKEVLLKNLTLKLKERVQLPWLKFAVELAVLDVYSPELLNHIFDEEFMNTFFSRGFVILDHLQLLLLDQTIKTLYPTYSGPYPPQDKLQAIKERNGDHVKDFPLQAALERGLGGSSYVLTRLFTKLGHFIDHLVVMRKGGFPVAFNQTISDSSKTFVEDLVIPSDGQIILIICLPESSYNINCQRLRAVSTLTLRTLEALDFTVVPVSLQLWLSLPEYEKIPYLMQNIKSKCESLDNEARIVH